MASLEKQQIVSFLKILQIPTNVPPEKIKQSLLEAGWNEKDADEAVTILHPRDEKKQKQTQEASHPDDATDQSPSSQIVAQRYVQSETEVSPKQINTEQTTQPDDEAAVQAAETITQELASKTKATDTTERPHTDAPWLEHQVDIYDVTPEEREEMIRTVYRTNEKLSPQTIHALLGIDVDLTELEESFAKRHAASDRVTAGQITTIVILSLLLAGFGFVFGMYYFEVGPFHPSMNS